ncbi:MAG: alanine racemase [Deltaproteobacteria bacterium]|nr:alanine racemase [Deltaproteobacteria bacterium]
MAYKRPTIALIDTASLKHNLGEIKRLVGSDTAVMAVIKANAYGHGDLMTANALTEAGCEMFGVAYVEEAVRLREGGVEGKIFVLAGIFEGQYDDIIEYALTPVVWDSKTAEEINSSAAKKGVTVPVHVKIDTGMGRLGVLTPEAPEFFKKLKNLKHLEVEGVMSHLAESEAEDKSFSLEQINAFEKCLAEIASLGIKPKYTHIANGAAAVSIPKSRYNLVRPGLMLYGVYPSPSLKNLVALKPALEFRTAVSALKTVKSGTPVSYSRTFTAKRDSTLAILPIGYGDGLRVALSNSLNVIINGSYAPVVGRICMDLCVADVTDVKNVKPGDEAVIIGRRGDKAVTAEDLALTAKTIPYEILTGISVRVNRVKA